MKELLETPEVLRTPIERQSATKENLAGGRLLNVLFSGFVFAATGFGTAARAYVHALHHASVNLSVVNRSHQEWRNVPDPLVVSLLDRPIDAAFCVCHTEPLDLPSMPPASPPLIALTTWEADTLPANYVDALNRADEVWTPSRYNAEVFRKQIRTPVFQLPHPMHVPSAPVQGADQINRRFGLKKDDYVVLSVATWQERKNLSGTIEAFFRAFPEEPGVKLLIKTSFAFTDPQTVRALVFDALKRGGISIPLRELEERLKIFAAVWTEDLMAALMQRAGCYISLHRSEGWCYPLFDAAGAGTPVVATAYSGPMDYLDPRFHHLVRYEITPVARGDDPEYFHFTPQMRWADPDPVHAAELLRAVYDRPLQARERAAAGAALLRRKYSFESIGRMARERLEQLAQSA